MKAIEIMMNEHRVIERLIIVVRQICKGIMNGEPICYEDFEKIIDFIRVYSDEHHHGKEEKCLFNQMLVHLGALGEKLIKGGMLVEHDLGRLYVKDLEEALERVKAGDEESKLDVIANAISYTHLLTRHIAKEDELIYPFALNKLPEEIVEEVNKACLAFEQEAAQKGVQDSYLEVLSKLEEKYK
ncbi:MAG: hemerythrin domain-containing protein [Zhenhengia sp.]|uniref:hemerythrin domain-containing protein n=1 Tax=Zhenhengia sp. TaxID=2944208 RepID=UPI003993D1A2